MTWFPPQPAATALRDDEDARRPSGDPESRQVGMKGRRELVERLARRVVGRRLEGPAVLFLELNKPLAFLIGQAALVASPVLATLIPMNELAEATQLLGSSEAFEELIQRIEDLARERDTESRREE